MKSDEEDMLMMMETAQSEDLAFTNSISLSRAFFSSSACSLVFTRNLNGTELPSS